MVQRGRVAGDPGVDLQALANGALHGGSGCQNVAVLGRLVSMGLIDGVGAEAVEDLASEMLRIQAAREALVRDLADRLKPRDSE